MYHHQPTSVQVIAIFHFIVGGLGLLGDLYAGVALASSNTPGFGAQGGQQAQLQKEMLATMEREIPGYWPIEGGRLLLSLAFDAALLAAGFGLLNMRPWARKLSIAYALVSLLSKVFLTIWAILYIGPAMDKAMGKAMATALPPAKNAQEQEAQQTMMKILKTTMSITAVGGPCLSMVYPFIVLLVMNTATVKDAFRNVGRLELGEEERRGLADDIFPPPSGAGPPDDRFTPR